MGTNEERSGLSRRDLMKKGAVAGGIVWTAPLVLSANSVASASHSVQPCTTLYYLKYSTNPSTGEITGSCEAGIGQNDCHNEGLVPGYSKDADVESGCGTAYDPVDNTVVLDTYLNKNSSLGLIQNVVGYTKAGNGGCAVATVTDQPVTAEYPNGGFKVTFPVSAGGAGASHVEISFCA